MWNDGYNVPFVVTDANGDLTTVVLFNLEPLDKDFKQSFRLRFDFIMAPVNKLLKDFLSTAQTN